MKFLVTGAAGFIGSHLSKRLIKDGHEVIGIDNLNPYYSVALKRERLTWIGENSFSFMELDIADEKKLKDLFCAEHFDGVINLAAQAGVRYSLIDPQSYINSNLVGFSNILECCRHAQTAHLVYASSSSVYGLNTEMPFSTKQNVDHPASLYAATKKSNELLAHSYSHLYGLPTTGLRFFTVYGPWGRPDMALFTFTKAILEDRPITVFNYGKMQRDFTYIDDIIDGIIQTIFKVPVPNPSWDRKTADPATSSAPYKIYNIGNNQPVTLNTFIEAIEKVTGKTAIRKLLPMQAGDVEATYADIDDLKLLGFSPKTSLYEGIKKFYEWYENYRHILNF